MDIEDAQREVRSVYIGGFWGQLVSSVIWLVSAALGTWVTPKASILTVVIGGFFIFPLTQMLLRLSGHRSSASRENPFNSLGMQVAFVLPFSMLLLVPVGLYNLNWFSPARMVLLGAHYLPFATLYGMRVFLLLAGILIATGVMIALYFSGTFSLGAWIAGLALFVFAWIGRSIATGEATAASDSLVRLMVPWDESGSSETEIPPGFGRERIRFIRSQVVSSLGYHPCRPCRSVYCLRRIPRCQRSEAC
jgi:hypothetical protein